MLLRIRLVNKDSRILIALDLQSSNFRSAAEEPFVLLVFRVVFIGVLLGNEDLDFIIIYGRDQSIGVGMGFALFARTLMQVPLDPQLVGCYSCGHHYVLLHGRKLFVIIEVRGLGASITHWHLLANRVLEVELAQEALGSKIESTLMKGYGFLKS